MSKKTWIVGGVAVVAKCLEQRLLESRTLSGASARGADAASTWTSNNFKKLPILKTYVPWYFIDEKGKLWL